MKKVLVYFLLIVVIASVSAWCAARFSASCGACTACSSHDWLHDKLHLTAEQKKALEPIESRFHEQYERANEQLIQANRELARTLAQSESFSPDVAAAIEMVHHRMGELQKLSIQHLYEMKTVLTPEQNKRLLQYAQLALEDKS